MLVRYVATLAGSKASPPCRRHLTGIALHLPLSSAPSPESPVVSTSLAHISSKSLRPVPLQFVNIGMYNLSCSIWLRCVCVDRRTAILRRQRWWWDRTLAVVFCYLIGWLAGPVYAGLTRQPVLQVAVPGSPHSPPPPAPHPHQPPSRDHRDTQTHSPQHFV